MENWSQSHQELAPQQIRVQRRNPGRQLASIDLPAVGCARRPPRGNRFSPKAPEPENRWRQMIAASVLDEDWVEEVKRRRDSRGLFIAGGLLEYFTEEENREIFACLAENFPRAEMSFQTMAPSLISRLAQYSVLSQMGSKVALPSGLDDSEQVSALHPKIEFVREIPLLEWRYDQLPEPVRQKLSPAMAKQLLKIVHVRFQE
jgi:O-methyltransferase involved in polyketide biosynthesis